MSSLYVSALISYKRGGGKTWYGRAITLNQLDTRYERYRLVSPAAEKVLLCSIRNYGIRDPLQGVDIEDRHVLLDGFKRYRCAKSLHIHSVPYRVIGSDEATGILALIRNSNAQSLTIIEQAQLICELRDVHKLSSTDIAVQLERSPSWVSMRVGKSMEDLNNQAHQWATVRFANRPVSKTGLIPVKAFEYEQSFLQKISSFVPAP